MLYPKAISDLIDSFSKLPGIGPKTAERLAFYTINKMSNEDVLKLSKSLVDVKHNIINCEICGHITDISPCNICNDKSRDKSTIAVVEESKDVITIEKMREYHGYYHVLHGVISPINGVGPKDINIYNLINRLKNNEVKELIIATNPSIEGESTAMYIAKLLENTDIKVTRLARGLPVGGDLEYADEITLLRALEGRSEI